MVNVLLEKVNRAICKAKVGAAGVVRLESPGDVPVLPRLQHRAGIAPVVTSAVVIDRDDRRAMGIAAVVTPPIILCQMVVLGRFRFTDHDCVGKTIRNIGKVDFGAKAIEATSDFIGSMGIALVRTPAIAPEDSILGVLKADAGRRIAPTE